MTTRSYWLDLAVSFGHPPVQVLILYLSSSWLELGVPFGQGFREAECVPFEIASRHYYSRKLLIFARLNIRTILFKSRRTSCNGRFLLKDESAAIFFFYIDSCGNCQPSLLSAGYRKDWHDTGSLAPQRSTSRLPKAVRM